MAVTNAPGQSRVDRATFRGREAVTTLLEADNTSIRRAGEELVVELFRYGSNGRAVESYRFTFCAEDRARLRSVA